ncbi:MAG: glycosyltransferase family 2 protein [Bacteroidetes bacterium]|nr:glycosyltransferase family 2 protein [Bacteroidota bacterium]
MSKISFVIPVFNRLENNKQCLRDLDKHSESRFFKENEVVIIFVDDGSTDGTGEWIRANYPDVVVLRGDGNLWYSGSLNMGMKYALEELNTDFIQIWENDIVMGENYFDHTQDILDQWDGNSLIASKLYYQNNPDIVFSVGGVFNPRTGHKGLIGRNQKDGPEYAEPREVEWFSGQQGLIHKDVIEKVGYLDDKNFPQYHADVDYSLRVRKAGFKVMIYPTLKLYNDSELTGISQLKNKTFKQFFESFRSIRSNTNIRKEIIFYRKHGEGIGVWRGFIRKYYIYTGSFIKWKVLGWFGVKKKDDGLL